MATYADIKNLFEPKCAFCGYDSHEQCLSAHHIFPKNYFKPQPVFDRDDRYLVLCLNCHKLLHDGIFIGDGENIIHNKLNYYKIKYANTRNIDNIIKLAKMVYAIAYTKGKV